MVDRYTKIVLTIIAAALVMIAARDVSIRADAQISGPLKVQVCDALNRCAGLSPIANGNWALDAATSGR